MSVGERIAELRKNENISQVQLAKLLSVSRQAVSKWETGQSLPDSMKMILLAEVLKTDVEYLTTGRRNDAIRPPVIIKSVEIVEKKEEVPVIKVVEKTVPVEKIVEVPVIQYVEKPVVKKVVCVITRRKPLEFLIVGVVSFLFGLLIGLIVK